MKRKIKVGQVLVDRENGKKYIAIEGCRMNDSIQCLDLSSKDLVVFSKESIFEKLKKDLWSVCTPYEL